LRSVSKVLLYKDFHGFLQAIRQFSLTILFLARKRAPSGGAFSLLLRRAHDATKSTASDFTNLSDDFAISGASLQPLGRALAIRFSSTLLGAAFFTTVHAIRSRHLTRGIIGGPRAGRHAPQLPTSRATTLFSGSCILDGYNIPFSDAHIVAGQDASRVCCLRQG